MNKLDIIEELLKIRRAAISFVSHFGACEDSDDSGYCESNECDYCTLARLLERSNHLDND